MLEKFTKQLYKEGKEGKKNSNLDIEKSKEIANEKLQCLIKPGFKDFSIRYMNIEEYKNILETGKISGEFIRFDLLNKNNNLDANAFLHNFDTGYHTMNNISVTQWEEMSGLSTLRTMDLITKIKKVEFDYKEYSQDEKNKIIREEIMIYVEGILKNNLREKIEIEKNNHERFSANYKNYNNYGHYLINQKSSIGYPMITKISEDASIENKNILKNFQEDENFLETKGNLRKVLLAINSLYNDSAQDKQYNLALLLDINSLPFKKSGWNMEYWNELSGFDLDKKTILGAVSINPLKEFYKEMIDLENVSMKNENFSHPIFDHKGVIRFPKNSNLDK